MSTHVPQMHLYARPQNIHVHMHGSYMYIYYNNIHVPGVKDISCEATAAGLALLGDPISSKHMSWNRYTCIHTLYTCMCMYIHVHVHVATPCMGCELHSCLGLCKL